MRCTARVLIVVSLAMAMAVGCGGGGLPTVSPPPGTALLSPSLTATETPAPSFTAGASATDAPASATPLATPAEETAPPTPSPTEPPTAPPTEPPTPAPASVNATVAFHSYDAATGRVVFRIVNGDGGVTLESVRARVVNRDTSAEYHHSYSNSPFRPSPSSGGADSLAPGGMAYLRYELAGHPADVPCRASITLHAGEGLTGPSAARTVDFHLPVPAINATVTYHSYDAAAGIATFRIVNNAAGARLQSVSARIINRSTGGTYYYAYSNLPFHTTPAGTGAGEASMAAGQTRYLRYELDGHPTGVPCRATITVHTQDGAHGASSGTVVDFDLVPAAIAVNASVTYHSYDAATGWVTFRVVNTGEVALESARTQIVNRDTSANYYGPGGSDSPFRASPTSNTLVDSVAPGATRYMRYKLSGNPIGVPCRATITLYAGEGSSGARATKTVDFSLPGAAGISATITAHSYNAATGDITFRIVNTGVVAIESAQTQIVNRATGDNYYGPLWSNAIFRSTPSGSLQGDVPVGATGYMVYTLAGNPTGVPCRASITIYSADNRSGSSVTVTVNFDLA